MTQTRFRQTDDARDFGWETIRRGMRDLECRPSLRLRIPLGLVVYVEAQPLFHSLICVVIGLLGLPGVEDFQGVC